MDGAGGYSGTVEEGTGTAQRNPQHQAAQKRLQQTQAKVDEVCLSPLVKLDGLEDKNILMFFIVSVKFSSVCC
jgi:hypothetical protein